MSKILLSFFFTLFSIVAFANAGEATLIDYESNNNQLMSNNPVKSNTIMISPNPAYNEIYIEWVDQIFNVEIISLQGNIIASYLKMFSNTTVSIRDLAKGTYLLKIIDNKTSESKIVKFLKN